MKVDNLFIKNYEETNYYNLRDSIVDTEGRLKILLQFQMNLVLDFVGKEYYLFYYHFNDRKAKVYRLESKL